MTDHTLTVTLNLDTEQLAAELRETLRETLRRHIATALIADRYAANEAKQREAEPDPLDEDDHRDRVDKDGDIWVRQEHEHWHFPDDDEPCPDPDLCETSLRSLDAEFGPITFAPEPAQEKPSTAINAEEA